MYFPMHTNTLPKYIIEISKISLMNVGVSGKRKHVSGQSEEYVNKEESI